MRDILSILQGLLFESPGPLAITCVLAGLVLAYCSVNRQKRSLLVTAMVLWAVAVAVFVLSAVVTTQRERVGDATLALIGATQQPMNIAGVTDRLRPDAVLLGPHGDVWLDASALPRTIESALTRWPVQSHRVRDSRIRVVKEQGQTLAYVEVRLSTRTTNHDDLTLGNPTTWRLIWQLEPSGRWRVKSIQWLEWMNQEPSQGMWR